MYIYIVYSSYVTMRNANSNDKHHSKWKRSFVAMKSVGNSRDLFFYNSKANYEANPNDTQRSRPLDMTSYVVAAMSEQPPFQLTLCHEDQNDTRGTWELRCDTIEEMYAWSGEFYAKSMRRGSFNGDVQSGYW